jgi:hypothetical protein
MAFGPVQMTVVASLALLGSVPASAQVYQRSGAHFSVTFQGPADEATAYRAVEILEAAYYRIGSALNVYPTKPIEVVLHTREQFFDVTKAPTWSSGVYDGRIRVPVKGSESSPEQLTEVLSHELTHAIVSTLAGSEAPAWLHEGLAGVFEQSGPADELEFLSRTPSRLPLSALMQSFSVLPDDSVSLAYALSAAAVKRLIDLRGASSVVSLLRALREGVPFENAFQAQSGMRFQDFDAMVTR